MRAWLRFLLPLLACAPLAFATEVIDGTNPPNPAKFAWDAGTKTATLLVDLTENVVITGDGVTLDGAGHSITGAGGGTGIDVQKAVGVRVTACTVRGWSNGIRVFGTSTGSATDALIDANLIEDNVAQGLPSARLSRAIRS